MDDNTEWNAKLKLLTDKLLEIARQTRMNGGDVSYETCPIYNDSKYRLLATVVYKRNMHNASSIVDMYSSKLHNALKECNLDSVVKIQAVGTEDGNDIITI